MNNSNSNVSGGIGFFGVLGIAFIILKLLKIINWSWLLVLCPLWAPVIICFIIYLILYIIIGR